MGEIKRGYFLLNKQQDNIIKHIFDRNTLPSQGIASAWEYPSLVGVPLVVILHECTYMTCGHTSHARNLGKPWKRKIINQQTAFKTYEMLIGENMLLLFRVQYTTGHPRMQK